MIRGYVQHVSTQEGMYFLSFDKMVEFMMNHLNPPPNHVAEQDEGVGVRTPGHDGETSDE